MSAGALSNPIALNDLVALNDEIAALARAGVPLDLGLAALGEDMPGRLGRLTTAIAERLQAGESLDHILSSGQLAGMPATYAAVVQAGIRAGRLPAALEGLAHVLRRGVELRRSIALALIYPLFVLWVTYSLLMFWLAKIAPILAQSDSEWAGETVWLPRLLVALGSTALYWKWIPPLLAALYGLWLWRTSDRAVRGSERRSWLRFGLVGRLRRMRLAGEKGLLAELLAVLIENGVPLDEALVIAGEAVNLKSLKIGARQLAESIRRGEPVANAGPGFPPVIACLLLSATPANASQALHRMATAYHDDAQQQAQWISTVVPLVFTVVFAASAVVFYACITIVPWYLLLQKIAEGA